MAFPIPVVLRHTHKSALVDLPLGPVCFSAWDDDWFLVATCGGRNEGKVVTNLV